MTLELSRVVGLNSTRKSCRDNFVLVAKVTLTPLPSCKQALSVVIEFTNQGIQLEKSRNIVFLSTNL